MKTATQTKVNLNVIGCDQQNAVPVIAENTNEEGHQEISDECRAKQLIDNLDDGITKNGLLKLYATHLQKVKSENLLREIEGLIAPVEAAEQRRDLLGMNNTSAISAHLSKDLKPNNLLEEITLEQCATLHVVSMRLLGVTSIFI